MVDFNSLYPDQEDIKLAFDRSYSIILDELQNVKDILKRVMDGNTYVDKTKCAEILHCKENEIPAALPYYRCSRTSSKGTVYKLSEIYDFIEERRVPRNK